jgi:hypothetical protein
MDIDKARRYDKTSCVDDFGRVSGNGGANLDNDPVGDRNISDKTRGTGSVDNGSIDDFEI